MPSAVIRRFAYRAESSELVVEFVTGRVYVYSPVPEEEARRFASALAKGVDFNRRTRNRYAARELDADEAAACAFGPIG